MKTCQNNGNIQGLLITDQTSQTQRLPSNVQLLPTTLMALRARFSEVLGVDAALNAPYKIYDFRPIFGLAFDEILRGFHFWGHVDLDQLFGRISEFIPWKSIDHYDRLFHRGSFSLYKNSDRANNLFRLPHPTLSLNEPFVNPVNFWFDETNGIYQIARNNGVPYYENNDAVGNLVQTSARMELSCRGFGARHQAFLIEDGRALQIYWADGAIQRREFMYFHIQRRLFPGFVAEEFQGVNSWRITAQGFLPGTEPEWSIEALDRNNRPSYAHLRRQLLRVARRKIKDCASVPAEWLARLGR